MNRPLAVLVTLALVLPVGVFGTAPSVAQTPSTTFGFAPEDPVQRDAKNGTRLEESPDGDVVLPSSEPVASATFVGIQADGTILRRPVESFFIEPTVASNPTFWVRNSAEGLDVYLAGPCIWGPPPPATANCQDHAGAIRGYLEVVLQNGGGTYTSTVLNVDYTRPLLRSRNVEGPRTIRVIFNEPVRVINDRGAPVTDSPSDWRVDDGRNFVVSVDDDTDDCRNLGFAPGTSGCTRILTLSNALGEDATPKVEYAGDLIDFDDPTRGSYEDYARNIASVNNAQPFVNAIDRYRPRIPEVVSVSDPGLVPQAPADGVGACDISGLTTVLTNNPSPTVRVTNILTTHTYLVEVDGDEALAERAVPSTPPFNTPALPAMAEGPHQIEVVAIDPSDNRSNSPLTSNQERNDDGDDNPFCYVLDVTPPLPGNALRVPDDPNTIVVTFLEDLAQSGLRGTWTVGSPAPQTATSVTAGDNARQLRVTFDDPVSAQVGAIAWDNDPNAYTDAAGNPVGDFSLPLSLPALPHIPSFTNPSTTTPRYTNQQAFAVQGRINPADAVADITEIRVTATPSLGGLDPANPDADRTWSTQATFPAGTEQTYRFTATAHNAFGDTSATRTSEQVTFDGIKPVVELRNPAPLEEGGLLGGGDPPHQYDPGAPVDVEIAVDETHYATTTVTVTYQDPDPNDGNPGPEPTVIGPTTQGNGQSQPFTFSFDPPAEFIGLADIEVVSTDLAGNVSDAQTTTIELTDAIVRPLSTVLTSNEPGDTRIVLTFGTELTGDSIALDWEADNGVQDDSGFRRPSSAQLGGNDTCASCVVTLSFPQQFPTFNTKDRNAVPVVTYEASQLLSDLAAADGREVVVDNRASDIDVPDAPTVTPSATVGPVNLDTDDPDGVDCDADPLQQGCPLTYTFTGQTHASARPNLYRVLQIPTGQDPLTAAGTPVPGGSGTATASGSFTFTIPVSPNATSTFRVEVKDPSENAAPPAVISVLEDSLGPDVDTLFASLTDGDTIDINYGFLPEDGAIQVALSYTTTGEDPEPITTLAVDETGEGGFAWNFPDSIDLASGGLQIHAVGTDIAGNEGQPDVAGLTNLPTLSSAFAGSLTSVTVTTSEPVTTDTPDASGFAISGGPGVTRATVDAQGRIVLALNGELPGGQNLRVTYNGAGGWTATDGRPLMSGSVPLAIDLILPVTDLAAGATGPDSAVLSFVDERNPANLVAGYEISRDGQALDIVSRSSRVFSDPAAGTGAHTYTVVTVATDGRRSVPATVSILLGDTPVPDDKGKDAESGGTGFPTTSVIVDPCVFTAEPNITPSAGGIVLSCDGKVAAIVPPRATDVPLFGKLIQRTDAAADGFANLTDLYQLVAVTETDFDTVDDFARYTELSFRALGETIAAGTPELMTTLRLNDVLTDEQAPRVGVESLSVHLLTVGTFRTVQAQGRSIRVYGPDPAIPSDRFATAVALSQTQYRRAGAAVLARADDYPDALSAAPLAALVGGPVLLSRTDLVPPTTVLELYRLGIQTITIVGGTAAVSSAAEQQLVDLGFTVRRIAGDNRFTTSALVAREVGSVDGGAFLATGQNFADALSASAPAASLGRPILLTTTDALLGVTLDAARSAGVDRVHLVGGTAALSDDVDTALAAAGLTTLRSAGRNRSETAVVLATDLLAEGLVSADRPLVASADGDGRTSPDALAAGPISGRLGSILLLTPKSVLPDEVAAFMGGAEGLAGMLIAGGPAAIDPDVRVMIDATG